jgi:hypothetical protein
MSAVSDIAKNDLLAKADAAIACGDYRQAIEYHVELLQRLSQQSPEEAITFREGPYADLLMTAARHAVDLEARNHFTAALDLVQFIAPYFGESEEGARGIESVRQRCIARVLYARSSPRASDVLLCCAEEDNDELQSPLAAALRDLGVLVATEPFVVSTRQSQASLIERVAASDAVVVVLSPSFFSTAWPQGTLHGLLNPSGPSAVPVLPVWHRITRPEVLAASEPLEKTLAFDTGKSSITDIAQGIADIVRPDLASGALHKRIWSAFLQGKTLGGALTEFELPVRHASLDEDLIARIRLIRAAFLDGCRQTMTSWIDGFSRELEPYPAIVEWQRLARAFQDARSLQRYLRADKEEALAQLVPADIDTADRDRIRESCMELERYSSDRLFKLIWLASQPMSRHLDVGFRSEVLGLASYILKKGIRIGPAEDDFESQYPLSGDVQGADWNVEGADFSEGVLHTEEQRPWSKPWDVFISHASEDKEQLVRPLADALKDYGIKVWYDSFNLRPGLSLGRSIDAGIAGAEFGIVVLSPHFITKDWPRYELDALRQRHTEQGERLLTLWHALAEEDRPEWTKALDPEKCLDTATQPITALTMRVVEWVRPDLARFTQRRVAYAAMMERQVQGQLKTIRGPNALPPRRYERLPAALLDRVDLLRAVLSEVNPHSMEFWLEGFLRDYTPERQIAFWERTAAMYQEAVCVIDWLQARTQHGLFQIFKRRRPTVGHFDVYNMINRLQNSATAEDDLSEFRLKYPEEIVNTVLGILGSPTVIELLAE